MTPSPQAGLRPALLGFLGDGGIEGERKVKKKGWCLATRGSKMSAGIPCQKNIGPGRAGTFCLTRLWGLMRNRVSVKPMALENSEEASNSLLTSNLNFSRLTLALAYWAAAVFVELKCGNQKKVGQKICDDVSPENREIILRTPSRTID